MDFFRNIPSPPAFPRPSSGRVDEARAPSFLVDVAGLSLVIAWTFVFWNGDGVGMAAAVCGSVDLLLALQSGATALFSALIAISLYARKRRLFLLLLWSERFCGVRCAALLCRMGRRRKGRGDIDRVFLERRGVDGEAWVGVLDVRSRPVSGRHFSGGFVWHGISDFCRHMRGSQGICRHRVVFARVVSRFVRRFQAA